MSSGEVGYAQRACIFRGWSYFFLQRKKLFLCLQKSPAVTSFILHCFSPFNMANQTIEEQLMELPFQDRWSANEAELKEIWGMLELYKKMMKDVVEGKHYEYAKVSSLAEDIISSTKSFYKERRELYSQSRHRRRLNQYDVFLSHAGAKSQLCWLVSCTF